MHINQKATVLEQTHKWEKKGEKTHTHTFSKEEINIQANGEAARTSHHHILSRCDCGNIQDQNLTLSLAYTHTAQHPHDSITPSEDAHVYRFGLQAKLLHIPPFQHLL